MSYFYADGADKKGNRLITSYKKEDQARRYRAGATITEGEKFLNIREDGSAALSTEGDLLLRTLMLRPEGSAQVMGGNFVVFAKINGKWQETPFRYNHYSAANAAVKSALIMLYDGCAVVEMNGDSASPMQTDFDPINL